MPLLDTRKYNDMNGLENLICDLILHLLSFMAEDECTRIKESQKEGISIAMKNNTFYRRVKEYELI